MGTFLTDAIIWDAHSCLPLNKDASISLLRAHHQAGVTFVSINIGMDMTPFTKVVSVLSAWRKQISDFHDQMMLIRHTDDVLEAKKAGRLGVAFDLEGSAPLLDSPDLIDLFYDLGVRQIHLVYNRNNTVGGGCHDDDKGLTSLGRKMVERINHVGMMMDCSHNGYRTSMDIIELSVKPVIFSHANPYGMVAHPRNIRDDQIDACVKTGGVIGINGISPFLGDPKSSTETLCNHIDYVVQRAGAKHVGIGLDYVYSPELEDPIDPEIQSYYWPKSGGYNFVNILATRCAEPYQIPEIAEILDRRGYQESDILDIMGRNFFRVAHQTWNRAKSTKF